MHGIKNKNRAQIPYVTLHFADVIGEARYQLLTNLSFRLCSHSDTTQFHVQTLEVALCSGTPIRYVTLFLSFREASPRCINHVEMWTVALYGLGFGPAVRLSGMVQTEYLLMTLCVPRDQHRSSLF